MGVRTQREVVAKFVRGGFIKMIAIGLTNGKWKYSKVNAELRAQLSTRQNLTLINLPKIKDLDGPFMACCRRFVAQVLPYG